MSLIIVIRTAKYAVLVKSYRTTNLFMWVFAADFSNFWQQVALPLVVVGRVVSPT